MRLMIFLFFYLSDIQGLVYNGDCEDDGSIQILSAGFDEVMAGIITTGNPDLVSVQTQVHTLLFILSMNVAQRLRCYFKMKWPLKEIYIIE